MVVLYIVSEQEKAKVLLDISNGTFDLSDFRKPSSVSYSRWKTRRRSGKFKLIYYGKFNIDNDSFFVLFYWKKMFFCFILNFLYVQITESNLYKYGFLRDRHTKRIVLKRNWGLANCQFWNIKITPQYFPKRNFSFNSINIFSLSLYLFKYFGP